MAAWVRSSRTRRTVFVGPRKENADGRVKQRSFADNSNPPTINLRRVTVRDGLWILEGVNDYGEGRVFTFVALFELKDGNIWRDTRYYAEQPFDAPQWRADLVERMES